MAPPKVICPQCQAALKLPPNMPAAARPKCPRCGTPVTLLGGAAISAAASAAKTTAIAKNTAVGRAGSATPGSKGVPEDMEPEGGGVHLFVALGLIAAGGLLVLALAVVLVVICLNGEPSKTDVAPTANEEEVPPPRGNKIRPAAKPRSTELDRPLIALTVDDENKVDAATRKGVEYLRRRQIKDGPEKGTWPGPFALGYASLAGLTLLESKVPANDPAVQNAAVYVRESIKKNNAKFDGNKGVGQYQTYQISAAILFLSRLDDPIDRPLIRSLALRLVASQFPSGGWGYDSNTLKPEQETELLAMLKDFPKYAGQGSTGSLITCQVGVFHKAQDNNPGFYRNSGDNSNTQFALLALWTARRYGLPLDPPLRLVAKRFRNSQEPSGRWSYSNSAEVAQYPTMTAAALLGLAVGYALDKDDNIAGNMANDVVLQRGFRALGEKVGASAEDKTKPLEMYFLWSVERVAVLYRLATIEGKDWYHWGLNYLVAKQNQDGKWYLAQGHGTSDIVDTCFALLFLQRANLAKDLTDKIQALAAVLGQMRQKE